MIIPKKIWLLFIVLAILGLSAWFKFSYPQFLFLDLSIDRQQAVKIATSYLDARGVATSGYTKATVFIEDLGAERYLQKALGFKREAEFIKKYDYELFLWSVRFFREGQKEEYRVILSSKSGKVISFRHFLEDTAQRPDVTQGAAKNILKDFLTKTLGVNFYDFTYHGVLTKIFDRRKDYSFSWEHKEVYIPWSPEKDSGGAKLIMGGEVSGNEITTFYKPQLDTPESFGRFIERQLSVGRYIDSVSLILFIIWLGWSISLLIKRRNDIIIHISKKWYMELGMFIFFLGMAGIFNEFQSLLFNYPTSYSFSTYFGNSFLPVISNLLFLSLVFLLPGLAAESLWQEVYPEKKHISFFHFLNSTFRCRSISKMIMLGYFLFFILIGLQAVILYFGQKYLGVWEERVRLSNLSSAYLPFLTALIIGVRASFNEEIMFRLFGISWGKRYLRSTALAVLLTSAIWGLGHSEYAVFPVWFRGIEVGILGLVLAGAFLRYGIVVAIVSHFVFDVFWSVSPYLLGKATPYLFFSSLGVMLLPLLIAIVAYFINGKEEERPLEWLLNKHQKFNLEVLVNFLENNQNKLPKPAKLKEELIAHGWDVSVVELAIKKAHSL